jgi:hypothetical protein
LPTIYNDGEGDALPLIGETVAMTAFQPAVLPAELTVIAYPDPTVEALGYGPDHPYIEGTRSKGIFELSECSVVGGGSGA